MVLACAGLGQACAQSLSSTYTSTAPKDCRQIGKPSELDGSTTRVCAGKAGLVVLIAEDDLREIVSVGASRKIAAEQPAAKVWFHPSTRPRRRSNGARPAQGHSRSSSAGTLPTGPIPTTRAGQTRRP
jgi:hypothetical protein